MLRHFFLVIILVAVTNFTFSQGCSDAGFCTLHSIKGNTVAIKEPGKFNQLVVGFGFGKGEDAISYYTPYIQYSRSFNRTTVSAKLNYSLSDGRLASTSGFSDLFISASHDFDLKKAVQKTLIGAVKMNIGQSDLSENGINLPLPYQPSLGTVDFIAGLNLTYREFGAGIAVQQPLTTSNDNQFLPSDYPAHPYINEYLPGREFERKGDALMRFSYQKQLGEKFSIRPGLLGIYHLDDDSYLNSSGSRVKIYGSEGLTLNGTLFLNLKASTGTVWELALGAPFVVRPSRPDGLTRSFVATIEYRISF